MKRSHVGRRKRTDLAPADIEVRLRGAHTLDQVKVDFDLPGPDYLILGEPFWTAETFDPWFAQYQSDGEARVLAHAQLIECEEARLRDRHRRSQATEPASGMLQSFIAEIDSQRGGKDGF